MDQETQLLLEKVANDAAKKAVGEAMLRFGIDHTDPLGVQRDMAALRDLRELVEDPELQKDLLHLRHWRRTMEAVHTKGLMTFVALVVTGIVTALWYGFKGIK